jgi:hypothetical protein
VKKLKEAPWDLTPSLWFGYTYGVATALAALGTTGVCLIWTVLRQTDLPSTVIGILPMTLVGVWFGAWGVGLIVQIAIYVALGLWTKKVLKANSIGRLDLDFGIRLPQMDETRPDTQATDRSFSSQQPTLHSPPRTPKSRTVSTRHSSATKVGPPSSSKTKKFRDSTRSSIDAPAFPAGEAVSIDSAFDLWDTSSVHREIRTVIHSSPPTGSGLEPIPGSRSESPANGLDGPFLPSSPVVSSSPHATSSETAETVGWSHSSQLRQYTSSPPSSPPNFSRPTSRPTSSHQKALGPAFGTSSIDASMQELIHPLFRPNSPDPPPVAAAGTMVTAAPQANEPITPKTLARIRGSSTGTGHWRAMPSIDKSDRPSTAGSYGPGSPGPSIVEEDDESLPPILPGFVLSAGQRTSLLGYGKRKSVKKERPRSQWSAGSRLSQVLP